MKQPKANQVITVKIPDDKISKYLKPTATVKEKEDFLQRLLSITESNFRSSKTGVQDNDRKDFILLGVCETQKLICAERYSC